MREYFKNKLEREELRAEIAHSKAVGEKVDKEKYDRLEFLQAQQLKAEEGFPFNVVDVILCSCHVFISFLSARRRRRHGKRDGRACKER